MHFWLTRDNQGYQNQQGGDYGGYNNQTAKQWGAPVENQQQSFNNQQYVRECRFFPQQIQLNRARW